MPRLLFITDFTEQFAYKLLEGIVKYSRKSGQQWVVCKMPPALKKELGIHGVVDWALKWHADVVIAQFEDDDDVGLFAENGIVAIAQDYRHRFLNIPNITADYVGTGVMAADHFLSKGFRNFAFFGYKNVCWSDERCEGFRMRAEASGKCDSFSVYDDQSIDNLWYYEAVGLREWLLSLPKPVAVMCCDDNQGNILLEACNSCGIKVPEELVAIGVDNDSVLCNLTNPSLSSIEVDITRGGFDAASMAARLIESSAFSASDIVLKPIRVVERLSTSVFATRDPNIIKALMFIHQNVNRKIKVPDVLAAVPLSRRLLEQNFKNEVGETLYAYISRMRVERFAHLLIATNDPVSEIALKMDEVDSKSISRRFKEIKGCTPLEYRNKRLRNL